MADETNGTPGQWDWAPAQGVAAGKRETLLRDARVFVVTGGTSRDIAEVGLDRADEANANARRIVLAVNSVAGIPSAALEAGLLTKALDLLAAGFLTDACDGSEPGCPSCEARRVLRALGRCP
jgi:hypothetical protein